MAKYAKCYLSESPGEAKELQQSTMVLRGTKSQKLIGQDVNLQFFLVWILCKMADFVFKFLLSFTRLKFEQHLANFFNSVATSYSYIIFSFEFHAKWQISFSNLSCLLLDWKHLAICSIVHGLLNRWTDIFILPRPIWGWGLKVY